MDNVFEHMDLISGYKDGLCSLYSASIGATQRFLSRFTMRVALLSTISLCATTLVAQSAVDSYVASESPIAKAGLLANIGPDGSKCAGAKVLPSSSYWSFYL